MNKVSLWLIPLFIVVMVIGLSAQDENVEYLTTGIPNTKVKDAEQQERWRSGDGRFSARPNDMWELGIGLGSFLVTGDVASTLPGGLGASLHLRKAINYTFSLRGEFTFGQYRSTDTRLMGTSLGTREYPDVASQYGSLQMPRAFQTRFYGLDLQALVNLGNLLFHKTNNKWNAFLMGGIGLYTHDTRMNFFDNNGNPYDLSSVSTENTTLADRRERRSQINDILNDEFETRARIKPSGFRLNDNMNLLGNLTFGVGSSRKITQRVNISLEYAIRLSDNDYLDGIAFRSPQQISTNRDIAHFTQLKLNINLGKTNKKTEPLYWVNPLDPVMEDIAELKRRPIFDITDSDGDGIIDIFDLEPDSPEGAIVDVKGRTLDSDGDGIPDHLDAEPYSPSGYEVDEQGRAIIPDYVTEEQVRDIVNEIVNSKLDNIKMEWYLPTIHFDLDKYVIKSEYYGDLHQIAQVMKTHPNIKVVARGHTDVRGTDEYNRVLSYNRAEAAINYLVNRYDIPRDRFLIQYEGMSNNLVEDLPARGNLPRNLENQQYLNRRVEFSVAKSTDQEMERPDGPRAGQGPTEERKTRYQGSRNVGY